MDKLYQESTEKYKYLIHPLSIMQLNTTSTDFLFSSPQLIDHQSDFFHTLICAGNQRDMRLVVSDKVHLHV